MTNDAAVAWVGSDFPSWANRETEQLRKLTRESQPEHGFVYPLYSATTVAELREELQAAHAAVESKAGWEWKVRAEAAERRVAELYGVLSDTVGALYRIDINRLDAGETHKLDVLLDRLQTALTKESP